jgi:hypothetical protein
MNPDLFSPNDPAVDMIPAPDHELFADVNFDGENYGPDGADRDEEGLRPMSHAIDALEAMDSVSNSADIEECEGQAAQRHCPTNLLVR